MTAPEPRPERVVCGARETRITGTWECVMPPSHPNAAHYWVRLNTERDSA